MTIIRRTADGTMAYVKGAPDVLLSRCTHRLDPGRAHRAHER